MTRRAKGVNCKIGDVPCHAARGENSSVADTRKRFAKTSGAARFARRPGAIRNPISQEKDAYLVTVMLTGLLSARAPNSSVALA
jgi:hypothetical protein